MTRCVCVGVDRLNMDSMVAGFRAGVAFAPTTTAQARNSCLVSGKLRLPLAETLITRLQL